MKHLTLKSPAKVNLYLKVLGKKPDGYHSIETILERIDLCDEITLRTIPEGIRLSSNVPELPTGDTNLAFKAAQILMQRMGVKTGVDIKITKRIPIASGLGGGSSNGATILMGLNRLWGLGLSKNELFPLGKRLGADVCFFLSEERLALGRGRGDEIEPLLLSRPIWHILATPPMELSSREAYEGWDLHIKGSHSAHSKMGLTASRSDVKILVCALQNNNLALLGRRLFNSLEEVASRKYGFIREMKFTLNSQGAEATLMSGSGPTVFGILPNREEAMKIKKKLLSLNCAPGSWVDINRWQVFVAKTF